MTIKQELINNINKINPGYLSQIFNLTEHLKHLEKERKYIIDENNHPLAKYVGLIGDAEAKEIKGLINEEFSNIEGDW